MVLILIILIFIIILLLTIIIILLLLTMIINISFAMHSSLCATGVQCSRILLRAENTPPCMIQPFPTPRGVTPPQKPRRGNIKKNTHSVEAQEQEAQVT